MDRTFDQKTNELLSTMCSKYDKKVLYKIKFENLKVLIKTISEYKPKSKIRTNENLMLEYLSTLGTLDLTKVSKQEILVLQRKFVYPTVTRFFAKGFRYKFAWVYLLIFFVIIDFLLSRIFDFYLPIFSILFSFIQTRKDFKAFRKKSCGKSIIF